MWKWGEGVILRIRRNKVSHWFFRIWKAKYSKSLLKHNSLWQRWLVRQLSKRQGSEGSSIDAPGERRGDKLQNHLPSSQYRPGSDPGKPFQQPRTQGAQVCTLPRILLIHTSVLQQVAPITAPKTRPPSILANLTVNQILHLPF